MHIGKPYKHHVQDVSGPCVGMSTRQRLQRYGQWKHVNLADENDQEAIVDALGYPGPEQELQSEKYICRDSKQVRLKGIKVQRFKDECQVCSCTLIGYGPAKPYKVDGPHVVVFEGSPEEAWSHGLPVWICVKAEFFTYLFRYVPIMHVAFGRIISYDSVC
jgi:hypothetical protein